MDIGWYEEVVGTLKILVKDRNNHSKEKSYSYFLPAELISVQMHLVYIFYFLGSVYKEATVFNRGRYVALSQLFDQ